MPGKPGKVWSLALFNPILCLLTMREIEIEKIPFSLQCVTKISEEGLGRNPMLMG